MGKFGQVLGKIGTGLLNAVPVVGPALANVASTIFSSRQQNRNVYQTNQANRELAEYQYSKDLEMWKLQNEYNSPVSQMQRFKDAGLNPLLVYDKGTPGNAQTLPKYQAPRVDYTGRVNAMANILGSYQDFQMKSAQIDLLQTQQKIAEKESMYADKYYYGRGVQQLAKGYTQRQYYHWLASQSEGGVKGFQLYDTQLQQKQQAIKKIEQDIIWKKKVNDWYITSLLGRLGLQGLNAVTGGASKLFGAGLRGVSGKFKTPATLPRYNSPMNWQNLGY